MDDARRATSRARVYQYNDVRTNALALAALNVWRRPLPQVLKENVMDPIGASNTWRWFGYENSWIVLDGAHVQSVTGGGHWGGGMFINAYDLARFGYLTLNRGRWKERQLLSEQWIDWALTPTPAEPTYGFMNWYNNKGRKFLPSAPRERVRPSGQRHQLHLRRSRRTTSSRCCAGSTARDRRVREEAARRRAEGDDASDRESRA